METTEKHSKNMNNLKIKITHDGCWQVNVLEQTAFAEHTLLWFFNLSNDESIVFSAFYNAHCFVVVDRKGWIQAFDIHTRQQIFNATLPVDYKCAVKLSRDGTGLHFVYGDEYRRKIYGRLRLPEFSQEALFVLPELVKVENFTELEDETLLFYTCESHDVGEHEVWEHGFYLVDPTTESHQVLSLPHAPRAHFFSADRFYPHYVQNSHYAGMSNWSQITSHEEKDPEKTVFTYQYDVINLTTFDVNTVSIRNIATEKLAFREESAHKIAKCFQNDDFISEEYAEAQTDFLETMCSTFSTGTDIWFAWREGVFRRLNVETLTLSPLIVVMEDEENRHSLDIFYPTIVSASESQLLVSQLDDDYWQIDISEIDSHQTDDVLELPMKPYDSERYIKASPELKAHKRLLPYYSIQVDDLESEDDLLSAIQHLADNDIDNMRRGNTLKFIVGDEKGNELDEEAFFKRIVTINNALPFVAQLIENFVAHPECAQLYIHEEASSLCYASYYLVLKDSEYLPLFIKHLQMLDHDHDVIFREYIIEKLLTHFAGTESEAILRIALSLLPFDEHVEYYLNSEYADENSWFHSWINNIDEQTFIDLIRQLASFEQNKGDDDYESYILEQIEKGSRLYFLFSKALNEATE